MSYKKRIFSIIITFSLNSLAFSDGLATYLPLTTAKNDASWILFGVNGFSDGTASSRSAVAAGFSTDFVEVQDTNTQDSLATWGLSASGATQPADDNLLAVEAIDDTSLTTLKVAAKVLIPYVESEPIRSMYIRVNSKSPNVKIDYKSSMEGQTLEIFVGAISPLYSVTLSQNNTYNNAAEAIVSVRVSASVTKLSSITDVIDYQFGNNPLDARYYSKTSHQDTAASLSQLLKVVTFYHFDSVSQQWKIWDSQFSGTANDFTAFSKGDAYWGRIDLDDNPINNDGTVGSGLTDSDGIDILGSGLVLGKSGETIPNADAYKYEDNTTKLVNGWNMLSFDDIRPYIRHASTGLVITSTKSNGKIIITDSTNTNSITISLTTPTVEEESTEINTAIEIAKLKGKLPSSFNIKAFASDTTANPDRIILISDAKFSIKDEAAVDNITVVHTLAGDNPYNENGVQTQVFTNLATATTGQSIAISAYGEYSIIADIMTDDLTGTATAASLDSIGSGSGDFYSAKITFGTTARGDQTPIPLNLTDDVQPDSATVKVAIESHSLFNRDTLPLESYGKAIALDSLNDGTEDKMIITSSTPFYIKDSTYTRVFDYNVSTADGARLFSIVGSNDAIIRPSTGDSVATVADLINDTAERTDSGSGVFAGVDGGNLVTVSTTLSTFDIKDVESGEYEFLESSSSSADIARGAVKGVYALDTIAKMPLKQHKYTYDTFIEGSDAGDGVTVDFSGLDTTIAGAVSTDVTMNVAGAKTDSEWLDYFDRVVAEINKQISLEESHGFAYHDFIPGDNTYNQVTLYIIGMEIDLEGLTELDFVGTDDTLLFVSNGDISTNPKTLGLKWTAITPDLKANAIYAPNYASYGPLYTLREAGFDVQAMLKATTDITDLSIAWDSIDLTRDEQDWFSNNEFNLFNVNLNSGYWVYLASKTSSNIVINEPSFNARYDYYFDNRDNDGKYVTRNIINVGQFSVEITGLDNSVANAYVSVNGEEIQLKRSGISDDFTADFTKYALKAFNENLTGPISMTIRATNGKGEAKMKYDAFTLDYTAPILNTPTSSDEQNVSLSADGNVTKFYVYNEYIPELYSSRSSASQDINRLVSSYDANSSGEATIQLCKELSFGQVDNLRIIGADGDGTIGGSNLSYAKQIVYATMLKSAHVLKVIGDEDGTGNDENSTGLLYSDLCISTVATADNGVSLKQIDDANLTGRLAYEVIEGVNLSTSVPWTTNYSIDDNDVFQVKSVSDYKNKPFFYQYDGKTYISAFPDNDGVTDMNLTDVAVFVLDADGYRDTSGGEGDEIFIINDSILMP